MSGETPRPAREVRLSVIMAHESGSFSIDTHAAAIKTATAGVSDSPGRWPARRPPTAPRNNAGNVGPPRKLPSERLHASPLNRSSSASVDSGRVGGDLLSYPNASWRENRH